jgi:hypothetical protein
MAERLKTARIVTLKQSDILACSHCILVPEHYRDDGSCKCDDPEHVQMGAWGYHWNENTGRWD